MNSDRGFTLIEVLISMVIILISMVGFFGYITASIQNRAALSRSAYAFNIATDVADRLSRLPSASSLVLPAAGSSRNVGYDSNGNIMTCSGSSLTTTPPSMYAGMTQYTNPVRNSNGLYLYDNNTGILSSSSTITSSANPEIDHPNSTDITNLSNSSNINTTINPIRRNENGITYYVVWSVAYMPCGSTDKANIFITVYWIEPEPSETSVSAVYSKIASGEYSLKNISIAVDKAYKIEK